MQPTSRIVLSVESEPNVELLRRHGWSVSSVRGEYCVAFRGADEIVVQWRNGSWQRVGGRGGAIEL